MCTHVLTRHLPRLICRQSCEAPVTRPVTARAAEGEEPSAVHLASRKKPAVLRMLSFETIQAGKRLLVLGGNGYVGREVTFV